MIKIVKNQLVVTDSGVEATEKAIEVFKDMAHTSGFDTTYTELYMQTLSDLRDAAYVQAKTAVFLLDREQVIEFIKQEEDMLQRARLYGYFMHAYRNLKYGKGEKALDYSVHLEDVRSELIHFLPVLTPAQYLLAECIAMLHDIIEDTGETYNDVVSVMGMEVADGVFALANEKGKNRKGRANDKYYREMTAMLVWIIVKLADRLSNMKRGALDPLNSMLGGYLKENANFRASLFVPGMMDKAWAEFDKMVSMYQGLYTRAKEKALHA